MALGSGQGPKSVQWCLVSCQEHRGLSLALAWPLHLQVWRLGGWHLNAETSSITLSDLQPECSSIRQSTACSSPLLTTAALEAQAGLRQQLLLAPDILCCGRGAPAAPPILPTHFPPPPTPLSPRGPVQVKELKSFCLIRLTVNFLLVPIKIEMI